MKITIGRLRRLIAEQAQLAQAKLSISGPNPPPGSFTKSADDESPDLRGKKPFIKSEPGPNYEPNDWTIDAWNRHVNRSASMGLNEPWDTDPPKPVAATPTPANDDWDEGWAEVDLEDPFELER